MSIEPRPSRKIPQLNQKAIEIRRSDRWEKHTSRMASEVVPVGCLPTPKRTLSREFVKVRSSLRPTARCLSRFLWQVGSLYDDRHQMHNGGGALSPPFG